MPKKTNCRDIFADVGDDIGEVELTLHSVSDFGPPPLDFAAVLLAAVELTLHSVSDFGNLINCSPCVFDPPETILARIHPLGMQ